MEQLLSHLEGVISFFDDMSVFFSTIEELKKRLRALFKKLAEKNLHVNEKKCSFFTQQVEYLGHVITPESIQESLEKVEAIQKALQPKKMTELLRFLGLVNHYHRFILDKASQ